MDKIGWMKGWRDKGMRLEGWKDGGMEGWKNGGMRLEGWRDGIG